MGYDAGMRTSFKSASMATHVQTSPASRGARFAIRIAAAVVVAVTAPVQAQPTPDAVFRAEAAFTPRDATTEDVRLFGEGVVIGRVCFNLGAYVIGAQRLPVRADRQVSESARRRAERRGEDASPADVVPGAIVYEEYRGSIADGMVTVVSPADGESWAWRVLTVGREGDSRFIVPQGCYRVYVNHAEVRIWRLGINLEPWAATVR